MTSGTKTKEKHVSIPIVLSIVFKGVILKTTDDSPDIRLPFDQIKYAAFIQHYRSFTNYNYEINLIDGSSISINTPKGANTVVYLINEKACGQLEDG